MKSNSSNLPVEKIRYFNKDFLCDSPTCRSFSFRFSNGETVDTGLRYREVRLVVTVESRHNTTILRLHHGRVQIFLDNGYYQLGVFGIPLGTGDYLMYDVDGVSVSFDYINWF